MSQSSCFKISFISLTALSLSLVGCEGRSMPKSSSFQLDPEMLPVGGLGISPRAGRMMLKARSSGVSSDANLSNASIRIMAIHMRAAGGQWYRFDISPVLIDLVNLDVEFGAVLARAQVPSGSYDQIRLITEEEGLAVFEDESTLPLRIPSGPSSGLKVMLDPPLEKTADTPLVAEFDFDLKRSFVFTPKQVLFKPVIRPIWAAMPGGGGDGGSGDGGNNGGGGDGGNNGGGGDGEEWLPILPL